MLSDADIERLMQVFQDRMQDVTDEYLELIGKHIAEIGTLAPSDINRLIEINRVNKDMSAIQRKLAAASGKSLQDIAKIFGAVAASDSRFAQRYFGHSASPASMRRAIEAQMRVTHGAMTNISQTTLVSKPYRKAVDAAIQAVQSGVGDYRSSVRRALKNCAVQGLKVQYPFGRKVRADTAVRQNVLDGVRAVNQQMLYSIGEEFGANGVEITAHRLCAEDHLPYQGRQFDGKLFHEIQSSLRRPFGMWNCRHTMFPIILGVSEPAYSEEELREYKEYSTEKIEIDGKTRTRYEWSQEMRRTETALRSERDSATLMKAAGDKEGVKESLRKQQELKDYYGKVSDASGVKKDWSRAQASGLGLVTKQTGGKVSEMSILEYEKREKRREKLALQSYEDIRKNDDIKIIAVNTGFSEDEIRQIKDHVFFDIHKLYDGETGSVSPDYDMAVAWRRLQQGSYEDRDILLLRHELLESQVEKEYNMELSEAHSIATKKHDWASELDRVTDGDGEPDDLLQKLEEKRRQLHL